MEGVCSIPGGGGGGLGVYRGRNVLFHNDTRHVEGNMRISP